jgi:preprotein translocase subunit YajC
MTTSIVTFGLIIVIFYFLLIRPQRKKDKETQSMISSIAKGDKVVTIGGIHGTVVAVREKSFVLKVDDNTRIEFNRSAISSVIEKKGSGAKNNSGKQAKKVALEKKQPLKEAEAPAEEESTAAAEAGSEDNNINK